MKGNKHINTHRHTHTHTHTHTQKQKIDKNEILLDDFDKTSISRIILSFSTQDPKLNFPVLTRLPGGVRQTGNHKMSRTSMHRAVKKLVLVCKKRIKKMQVYQRIDVVVQRH